MDKNEIYEELKRNPKNVRFEVVCKAAELFGFRFRGVKEVIGYMSRMVCAKC